jgi:pSer/pThr/pTyr-binding forkhead associated (FHA) protein
MPEAETSKSHQSLPSVSSTKPSDSTEVHLLVVNDDTKQPREYPLGGDVYSIGRAPSSNIRLYSLFVSRRHATLIRQQKENGTYSYKIVDGDGKGQLSANGILIDNRKLQGKSQSYELKDGDEIIFGPGVSAKYHLRNREEKKSAPLDPFDITLIDPGMVDESEEEMMWDAPDPMDKGLF